VLLFVHGYNTPFADGVYRTAQFGVEMGFRGIPVLFAWPGGEHWWDYLAAVDRVESASWELASLLRLLVDRGNAPNLYVVAHSMGNRVLARAIERLANDSTALPASSRALVLAAPDIDRPQFLAVTGAITKLFQRRTVYVSDTDVALQVSSAINQGPRVGQRHPLSVGNEFEIVDATGVRDSIIGHSYFVDFDSIANDISKGLFQGISAAQRGLVLEADKTVWRIPR
jgi:esterase/lipase superfamily enzyme